MHETIPEPEYLNFDNLSVLELKEEDECNQSVLSSQLNSIDPFESTLKTPKLSIATNTTNTKVSKSKTYQDIKKDEFDYNNYIKEELKKLKAEELDTNTRKKLIQKIRNRMSAQRSRNRNKLLMSQLQDENQHLRGHNSELVQKLNLLKEENSFLRAQLKDTDLAKRSYSTDESYETQNITNRKLRRISSPQAVTLYKNILVISAIVMTITLGPKNTPEGVKLGGIVPLLTNDINKDVKQLHTMENICKDYCLKHHHCDEEDDNINKQVRLLAEITKEVQVFDGINTNEKIVPLMCYDHNNEKVKHVFLFKESSLQMVRGEGQTLYAPELVLVKPEIGFINN